MNGVVPTAGALDPTGAAVVLILLAATALAFAAVAGFRALRGHKRTRVKGTLAPPAAEAREHDPAGESSLEGVLVRQLTTAEISQHRYRREMEQVAAREDQRNKPTVPPDGPPAPPDR